jgi:hypothetical protein
MANQLDEPAYSYLLGLSAMVTISKEPRTYRIRRRSSVASLDAFIGPKA